MTAGQVKNMPKNPDGHVPNEQANGEKLQKVLAHLGLGSRRQIEKWIEEGRLTIDGKLARLGDRLRGGQSVRLDGKTVALDSRSNVRVLLYHKPQREVCSRHDPEGRKTVFERLPRLKTGRWISVGRLDFNTSGVLLFTTDGIWPTRLCIPRPLSSASTWCA
jgi:23S rRNA pseudouridine2605 synthase